MRLLAFEYKNKDFSQLIYQEKLKRKMKMKMKM